MPTSPPLVIAPYRDIAADVARRLVAARNGDPLTPWPEEVIVPSRGMADAIAAEVLKAMPSGVAALRLQFL